MSESLSKILESIGNNKSFILEAGAGSGKTWSLVETIKRILADEGVMLEKYNKQIVCITYTNVAKDEIEKRLDYNPLVKVGTIHEFLWSVIGNYQNELRKEVLAMNEGLVADKKIEGLDALLEGQAIVYSQYGRKFAEGKISHDEVIVISCSIFKKYPKISRLVQDKYPYIFVDEYQDTQPETVSLLVDHLLPNRQEKVVVGFFGDSMQKIYKDGVGEIKDERLTFITKGENFRCSKTVIQLLNKLRPSLQQIPAGTNKVGSISFYHCNNCLQDKTNFQKVRTELAQRGAGFEDFKILFLTHRGIADKLGYEQLLAAYNKLPFGREQLMKKEECFSDFLLNKVEKLAAFYEARNYSEFLRLLGLEGFSLKMHTNKEEVAKLMEELNTLRESATIGDVIDFAIKNKLLASTQRMEDFVQKITGETDYENKKRDVDFYNELMKVKYEEVTKLHTFIEDFTPFSTKHGVKGAEFENVLVVIDDAAWKNEYNFSEVFSNTSKFQDRLTRSLNLLYVCCSRAKNNLVVLSLSQMNDVAMGNINQLFTEGNVYDVSVI